MARRREIILAAHWEPNGLRIVVDDDGAGFDAAHRPGARTRAADSDWLGSKNAWSHWEGE